MTGPSRGMLKAPLGRISLKNIWVIILQNINAASYGTAGILETLQAVVQKEQRTRGNGNRG